MKNIIYTLLLSAFLFSNYTNAQNDQTLTNQQDTFTYKKLEVIDSECGTIAMPGGNSNQQANSKDTNLSSKSSGLGETPGILSVSPTGGANYHVPIAVPPGINGVTPEVSLAYDSQGGNGLAGYGWNVSGVSMISRIPSTKFHDNNVDGVDFDNLDRFALDGERLILKSGTYGGSGAQYETENYSNLKITSHGTSPYGASYGPAYFIVYHPDGSKAYYGNSSDSRSHTTYAITYWENPQGVRVSYDYTTSNNSLSINKIKYGSLGAATSINEIRFSYNVSNRRERWEQAYINDVSFVRTNILNKIEVFGNGSRYRFYDFTHDNSNLGYTRLTSVKEYSGDGTLSHSPINFGYSDTNSSVSYSDITTNLGLTNIEQRNAESVSFDMTGNGKMDFLVYPKDDKNKFWLFKDLQNQNTNYPFEVTTGYFQTIFPTTLLNHLDKVFPGQGITVVQNGTDGAVNFKVYSNGTTNPIYLQYTKTWNAPYAKYTSNCNDTNYNNIPRKYVSGDFNGDGLTDVLAINSDSYQERFCTIEPCDDSDGGNDGNGNWFIANDNGTTVNADKDKEEDNDRAPGGGSGDVCCTCDTFTRANTPKTYFIDLNRSLTSNFSSYSGTLQQPIEDDDKLLTGDFNGDGKTDLLHVADGKLFIYTLDNSNALTLLWETIDGGIKTDEPLLLGDFNGDGKTDFIDPGSNNSSWFGVFMSTGTDFLKELRSLPFTYKESEFIEIGPFNQVVGVSSYNLVPLDINGDGRTDIVDYSADAYFDNSNGTQEIKVYHNMGLFGNTTPTRIKFEFGGQATKAGDVKPFPIPIFLTSDQPNKSLDFATISNQWVTNFTFTMDHREDMLLRSVSSNGVTHTVDYSNLDDPDDGSVTGIYESLSDQVYPNIDIRVSPGSKVVTMVQRMCANTPTVQQTFAYQGAVYNLHGLGFLGFSGVAQSNWHTDNSDRIYNVAKYDPSLRGAVTANYSQSYDYNFLVPSSNYIAKTTYQNTSTLSASNVFKLTVDAVFSNNNLDGSYTYSWYQYDQYNNPTSITTNYSGAGNEVTTISYDSNTGSNYYIGRITNSVKTTTVGSETFSTENQYTYNGYLLSQKKTRGNGTPFDVEDFEYDAFGNVTKKTITPSGSPSREITFEYDSSGRFLSKAVDVEGLENTYQFNTSRGILISETNPIGQLTSFEYDAWDRLVKATDYLGNEITTSYVESSNTYTVTDASDDGSSVITTYDPLRRVTKVSEKNTFGDWVNRSFEYDKFGRVSRESEPYTGSGPTQWNEVSYDFYGRPVQQTLYTGRVINISYSGLVTTVDDGVKTVSSTRNGLGHTVSVNDPGGSINYTYFGNGALKTANYNGVVVTNEQDGWGQKTKTIDPSAGTYEYAYNGFGELVSETTPKGSTDYVYSPIGKLLQKTTSGDNTDMTIDYTYHPTYKSLSSVSLTSADGNNSSYTYTYDSNAMLISLSESNPYAQFTKQYTYDAFGRISTEQYNATLLLNNKTSSKKVKYVYQNGGLKAIQDFTSSQTIWEVTAENARGQVTQATYGNNIVENNTYDAYGYLTNNKVSNNTTSQILMELTTDFDVQRGTLNSRTNSMFSWSETFGYDNLDRLITFNDNNGNNSHTYDDLGRITANNIIGDYNYTGTSYQVASIDLNNQGDLYYQQHDLQQITYNAFKKPFEIHEEGKENIRFQYNAFMGRSHMFYGDTEENILDRNNRKHYAYDGSMEISYDGDEDETLFVTYIGGDAYSAPAIWRSEQDVIGIVGEDYFYLHRDYLGSIVLLTDSNGNAAEKRHFDAWGNTVQLTDGNDDTLEAFKILDRGYTGHEHLQGVNLIHMNGRLYDPQLRRFLAPDNFIQDISNTQNFNRYSYVLNNPLKHVDINGEEIFTLIATIVFAATAVVGAYALITNLSNQSGGGSSSPNQATNPFSEAGVNSSLDIASSIPRIPVSSFRADYLNVNHSTYGINQNASTAGSSQGNYKNWFLRQAHKAHMFATGFRNGFAAGGKSTWNFIKSLGTAQGWKDLGQGIVNLAHLGNQYSPKGMMMRAQMSESISNYVSNIPNMSAYEVGHDLGYGTEKFVESAILTRGAGTVVNFVRGSSVVTKSGTLLLGRGVKASWGKFFNYRHGGQMSAIEHIMYRHAHNSGFTNVSRFSQGTSVKMIKGYVDEAVKYGKPIQGGFEYNIGRVIGTGQNGAAASSIRVFIKDGWVRTAFPF